MEARGLQLVSPPSTPIPDTLASFPGIHPGLHMAVQPIHHILHIPGQGRCRKLLGSSHRTQERCPSQPSVWSPPICIAITSSLFAFSLPLLYIPWRIFSSPERKSNTYPRYFTQIIFLYPETHHHLKDVIFLPEVSWICGVFWFLCFVLFSTVFNLSLR